MIKTKRFVIETDEETHTLVKTRALFRNMTISDYILQAIAEKILREQQYEKQKNNLYEH